MRRPSFARLTATVISLARDRFGDHVETGRWEVARCTFAPGGSSEIRDASERVVSGGTLYGPAGLAAVRAVDHVEIRGVRYQVEGNPSSWPGHVEVRLRRVEG